MFSEEASVAMVKCQEIGSHGNSIFKPKFLLGTALVLDQFIKKRCVFPSL
jgi:hypothetical protein